MGTFFFATCAFVRLQPPTFRRKHTKNMMAIKSQFNGEDECETVKHDVSKDRRISFILHHFEIGNFASQNLSLIVHDILFCQISPSRRNCVNWLMSFLCSKLSRTNNFSNIVRISNIFNKVQNLIDYHWTIWC